MAVPQTNMIISTENATDGFVNGAIDNIKAKLNGALYSKGDDKGRARPQETFAETGENTCSHELTFSLRARLFLREAKSDLRE